jgi:hypothetical protein
MARIKNSPAGCIVLPLGIVALGLLPWIVVLAAIALAAPAEVPYFLLNHPRQFRSESAEWLIALGASPVVSLLLVATTRPRRGQAGRRDLLTKADRSAIRVRRALQAVLLLVVTCAAAWVMLAQGIEAAGRPAFDDPPVILVVGTLIAALAALSAFRGWDYWYPPLGEPVSVETVRSAAASAKRELQQLRAHSRKVERLAREIEEQLGRAWSETEFASLRNKHYESFSCANVTHGHYLSAQSSCRTLSVVLRRARAYRMPRAIPLRDPHTGRRSRPDRAALKAAGADLDEYRHALAAEAQRGLAAVKSLNLRTATFRDSIRDRCGLPGQQWYVALEGRKQQAQTETGRRPRADQPPLGRASNARR